MYCVTAEQHKKTYRNGTSQVFAYYRCTKKSKVKKCTQPYISEKKLDDQIVKELEMFELEPEFAEWALETLDELKGKEQNITEDKYKALELAFDGVTKRINNLISLKISPENYDGSLLSDAEFAERKKSLLQEKEKVEQQLASIDPTKNDWVQISKDSFNFALQACKRFQKSSPDEKKLITRTVGSNLILLDHNLEFQPRFLFLKYKEGVKQTKVEIARLVPENGLSYQTNLEDFAKSSIWYRQRESNPRSER